MFLHLFLQNVDLTNLESLLLWLVLGGGSVVVVNKLFSYLVANWTFFANLPSNVKFLIALVAAPVIAVLAQVLLGYTELLAQIQPWFQIAMLSILGYVASQSNYIGIKRADYGKQ